MVHFLGGALPQLRLQVHRRKEELHAEGRGGACMCRQEGATQPEMQSFCVAGATDAPAEKERWSEWWWERKGTCVRDNDRLQERWVRA